MKTILTAENKRIIHDSIKAAKFEGNDCVCLDSDGMISLYADKLTSEEYKKMNWDSLENELFDYAEKMWDVVV